jgi:RNA polymerase sigma-70 factor, ECF subfamily
MAHDSSREQVCSGMDAATKNPASLEFRMALVECIPHLRAFARSLTRNREQADDLVHDAAVRALTAESQFSPGTNFKAWIFTILRNLYYNRWREHRVRSALLEDPALGIERVGPPQEAALKIRDFKRAFWQLGQDQREALILVGASGMSYEEAAAICQCPVGTVKSRVSRARQQLLQPLYAGPVPPEDIDLGAKPSGPTNGDPTNGDRRPHDEGSRRRTVDVPARDERRRRIARRAKDAPRREVARSAK